MNDVIHKINDAPKRTYAMLICWTLT